MGNTAFLKMAFINSVRIKMYDSIINTLNNIRHVSKLKKNFIFVKVLDMKGFKCKMQYGGQGDASEGEKGDMLV